MGENDEFFHHGILMDFVSFQHFSCADGNQWTLPQRVSNSPPSASAQVLLAQGGETNLTPDLSARAKQRAISTRPSRPPGEVPGWHRDREHSAHVSSESRPWRLGCVHFRWAPGVGCKQRPSQQCSPVCVVFFAPAS